MTTVQPTLMTGPYDWDPGKTPLAEYQERVGRAMAAAGTEVLLVAGDRAEFGALAWLTGFVPKLGPALAVFPKDGTAALLFSGGPGMVGSARRLSWVEEMRPLGAPAKDLADLAGRRVALWGEGAMSARLYAGVAEAVGGLVAVDAALDGLRRRKSASELVLLRRAAVILKAVAGFLSAGLRGGDRLGEVIVGAERLGYGLGAQDVRVLVSRREGGAPLPVDDLEGDRAGGVVTWPATAHVAVRFGLYWAQGWYGADELEPPALQAGMVADAATCGIGLSLAEAPWGGEALVEGDVVCVREGAASVMLVVGGGEAVPF